MEHVDIYNNRHEALGYTKERKSLENGEYRLSCFAFIMNDNDEKKWIGLSDDDISFRLINIAKPHIFPVRYLSKGDIITFIYDLEISNPTPLIAMASIDPELFEQGFALLSAETLHLSKFTNTVVAGTITTKKDGLLYTSIPYEKHWTATVNGIKSDIVKIGGCMAALPLAPGTHNIEFRYYNKDLVIGSIISLVSMVLLMILIFYDVFWRKRAKNG